MPKAVQLCCGALAALLAVMVLRALTFPSMQPTHTVPCDAHDSDWQVFNNNEAAAQRLATALRFQTVSTRPGVYNTTALTSFLAWLETTYSGVWEELSVSRVGGFSLLMEWKGSNDALKPIMLASHMDVVPVHEKEWEVPPFEGRIIDGVLWGRGALDDKGPMIAILEAVARLVQLGHKPARTIYIAFGHDEEVSGLDGAKAISAELQRRGVQLEYMMDEGMPIVDGQLPGVSQPVALIGTAEKGWTTIELEVTQPPGHSSMPPKETAIGIMANALAKLEANPMPARLEGPLREMFEHIASDMAFLPRLLMSNLWLTSPLLSFVLSQKRATNAALRTTTALTMINGGVKENVLAARVTATVNHRIHPFDDIDAVLAHNRRVIGDDRVKMTPSASSLLASPVSPCDDDAFGYQAIQRSVKQVFPEVLVAPSLFLANSDTRHYWPLTKAIYRFFPFTLRSEDIKMIHGNNERLAIRSWERACRFYHHLLVNSDAQQLPKPGHNHHADEV